MSEEKNKPGQKMDFEKEKIELVKLRIKNKYYERTDVLEEVISSILKNNIFRRRKSS